MALTPGFSVTQSVQSPTIVTLTDTSTGSDGAVTQRRVYLQKADGTYLVPSGVLTSYVPWAYAQSSIAINALDRDYCLSILVQWLDTNGNVLYSVTSLLLFTLNSELALYSLTQTQVSNPSIINDSNYYDNKLKVRMGIDEATNAINYAADQASAQDALDRVYYLISNQSMFF